MCRSISGGVPFNTMLEDDSVAEVSFWLHLQPDIQMKLTSRLHLITLDVLVRFTGGGKQNSLPAYDVAKEGFYVPYQLNKKTHWQDRCCSR